MSAPIRFLIGIVLAGALYAAGVVLLRRGMYGLTLFVLFPLLIGILAAWVFRPRTAGQAAEIGTYASAIAVCWFMVLGMEGAICILMTLPLALPLGALGGWLFYWAEPSRSGVRDIALLLLLPPASLAWDMNARPPVYEVRTAIEIAASPEQVWKHVIAFPKLREPDEWYFRAGIAYPQRARIEGTGVGATRFCEFSTGPFVEPIEIWDEPRLLRFQVTENPAPMREWSPFGDIQPMHLHGYLVAHRGQFLLTRLAGNRTLLEGTTWYQHGLWPAQYWRWWSDAIIHRIHLRVLNHIRVLAEVTS